MIKKLLSFALALVLVIGVIPISSISAGSTTKNYPDVTLSGGYQAGHFDDVWDLTQADMVISFTYDANGLVDDSGCHAWAEFGVRSLGYGDFNPTWMNEGAGVWLATDYDWTANTFDPDPAGAPTLDLDDKLLLQKGGGKGEGDYNLPSDPPNPWANHRFWFDRDGVDQWQAQSSLAVNGGTYNTNGIYNIVIKLHATSDTTGTAYMTINGLDQGFETDNDWSTMELTPAGMTFTGDLKRLQVFYGLYGYGDRVTHSVSFKNIMVTGVVFRVDATVDIDPDTLNLKSKGQWITVYIELPEGYDPRQIDLDTVKLNGEVGAVTDPKYDFVSDPNCYLTDKDEDGILERMVKFDRSAVQGLFSKSGNYTVTISGQLLGWPAQLDFSGSDTIRVK